MKNTSTMKMKNAEVPADWAFEREIWNQETAFIQKWEANRLVAWSKGTELKQKEEDVKDEVNRERQ